MKNKESYIIIDELISLEDRRGQRRSEKHFFKMNFVAEYKKYNLICSNCEVAVIMNPKNFIEKIKKTISRQTIICPSVKLKKPTKVILFLEPVKLYQKANWKTKILLIKLNLKIFLNNIVSYSTLKSKN